MARWRLISSHYLNVPGNVWEQKELDQLTGKQGRKTYEVPLHLDVLNPTDYNYPDGIYVTNKADKAFPRDILFIGAATAEMEPLDAEAEKISAEVAKKWKHPIESLPAGTSPTDALLQRLTEQLDAAMRGRPIAVADPVSTKGVDNDRLKALEDQVAALMARNAELEAAPKALRRA